MSSAVGVVRNVHFVSGLMETGVQFRCCDFPTADRTMVHIYAAMAEHEGTASANASARRSPRRRRARKPVGNASSLRPLNDARASEAAAFAAKLRPALIAFMAHGLTQRAMVDELNKRPLQAP